MKNRLKAFIIFLLIAKSFPSFGQNNIFRQKLLDTFVMRSEDESGELHTGYNNEFIAYSDSAGLVIGDNKFFIKVNYISRNGRVAVLSKYKGEPYRCCFVIDFSKKKLKFILNWKEEIIMYLKD